jgi:hypothetical protein
MGDADDPKRPRIKLSSFKEVQGRGVEKSTRKSAFRSSGLNATSSAKEPAGDPKPTSAPAHNEVTQNGTTLASRAPTPMGFAAPAPAVPPLASGSLSGSAPVVHGPVSRPFQHNPHFVDPVHSAAANDRTESCAASDSAATSSKSYSAQIGHGNAILVNRNQHGNPVLKHVRNVNYRFADVIPDFQFNDQVRNRIACCWESLSKGAFALASCQKPLSTGFVLTRSICRQQQSFSACDFIG